MVAQAAIENHAARRREGADGLVDRNWLLEREERAGGIEAGSALVASHDDQGDRALPIVRAL